MAGDINAKQVDWNSRLKTRRGKLLREYADGNTCLIFGPDSPTTKPYKPLVTPGHRDNQETLIPGVSDFVLRTKLGPSQGSH